MLESICFVSLSQYFCVCLYVSLSLIHTTWYDDRDIKTDTEILRQRDKANSLSNRYCDHNLIYYKHSHKLFTQQVTTTSNHDTFTLCMWSPGLLDCVRPLYARQLAETETISTRWVCVAVYWHHRTTQWYFEYLADSMVELKISNTAPHVRHCNTPTPLWLPFTGWRPMPYLTTS